MFLKESGEEKEVFRAEAGEEDRAVRCQAFDYFFNFQGSEMKEGREGNDEEM